MRFLCWLSILAFAASAFANPAQPLESKDAARLRLLLEPLFVK
jgi:hypothetical protein